ncbi:MAG: ABC transporter permease [Methylacidiphilales bacterium]|nr:ABC transporter permease [Candidatus Methylacidiphilales bacterium]MDW8349929.1 FtsX-like permease family protein [Verrucomicrobiae bacterium]
MFFRYLLKGWAQYPIGFVLNGLSLALAVAVYVAVQCVNESAHRAFVASVNVVAGRADTEVVNPSGMLPEENYLAVIRHPDVKAATPILERFATLTDFPNEYLRVVGVDFFSNAEFATVATRSFTPGDESLAEQFLSVANGILISDKLARRLNIRQGAELGLQTSEGVKRAKVIAIYKLTETWVGADEHIAVMDIAHAQDFFGYVGQLSRIDIIRHEGVTLESLSKTLQPYLTAGSRIQEPLRRTERLSQMTEAFRLNLIALSLVAMLVTVFLIYNTTTAMVARRYYEIGIWRALGASRGKIMRAFIAEAVFLALIATMLGLPLGYFLSRALIEQASQTISSLYVTVNIQEIFFPSEQAAVALSLAVLAALAGAWLPARQASSVEPVKALQPAHIRLAARQHIPSWTLVGFLLIGASLECARYSERYGPQWLSFGTALFLLLGVSFLCPLIFWVILKVAKIFPATFWRLGMEQFELAFTRNVILAGSIVCVLAMVVGIMIMVSSFRVTVNQWILQTVRADLYISPVSASTIGSQEILPQKAVEKLRQLISDDRIDLYREVSVEYGERAVRLAAIRFDIAAERGGIRFLDQERRKQARPELLKEAAEKGWIIASESFARRHKVRARHRIRLLTPGGEKVFRIAGIFQDYTSESGLILMDRKTYQEYWNDDSISSVAIYLPPEESIEEFKTKIRDVMKEYGTFTIQSNRELRRQVMKIFDQTFAITHLLQVITMLICGVGVYLNVLVHGFERSRIVAALRALGASRFQILKVYTWETLLLAVVSVVVGVAAGYGLAWVLAEVINKVFFGWTINLIWPRKELLVVSLSGIAVVMIAVWMAAWRVGRRSIAQAMKVD